MSGQLSALSLWQPWATLVVLGSKCIETRHWRPPASLVGERLAIHATQKRQYLGLADQEWFHPCLLGRELPLGAIVGHVRVDSIERMGPEFVASMRRDDPQEAAFGHYAVGRYAWHLSDPVELRRPVPWRGHQSIFSVPASVVGITPVQPEQGTLL